MNNKAFAVAAGLVALALGGCGPAILAGTGAVIGKSVAEERSTMAVLRDNEIKLSISNRLMNASPELFAHVVVDVVEGRVLLMGMVPSAEDKARAVDIAWKTEGVNAVDDELTVGKPGGAQAYLEDVRISNTLRWKMFTDPKISASNYNVETIGAVVYLSGLAESREELARVLQHARGIKGVKRVVSHVLTIDDPRRVTAVGATQ